MLLSLLQSTVFKCDIVYMYEAWSQHGLGFVLCVFTLQSQLSSCLQHGKVGTLLGSAAVCSVGTKRLSCQFHMLPASTISIYFILFLSISTCLLKISEMQSRCCVKLELRVSQYLPILFQHVSADLCLRKLERIARGSERGSKPTTLQFVSTNRRANSEFFSMNWQCRKCQPHGKKSEHKWSRKAEIEKKSHDDLLSDSFQAFKDKT